MIYKQISNLNKTQTATMKFVSLMVGLVGNTLFFHSVFRSLVSGFDFSHKDSCLSHHGPAFLLFNMGLILSCRVII